MRFALACLLLVVTSNSLCLLAQSIVEIPLPQGAPTQISEPIAWNESRIVFRASDYTPGSEWIGYLFLNGWKTSPTWQEFRFPQSTIPAIHRQLLGEPQEDPSELLRWPGPDGRLDTADDQHAVVTDLFGQPALQTLAPFTPLPALAHAVPLKLLGLHTDPQNRLIALGLLRNQAPLAQVFTVDLPPVCRGYEPQVLGQLGDHAILVQVLSTPTPPFNPNQPTVAPAREWFVISEYDQPQPRVQRLILPATLGDPAEVQLAVTHDGLIGFFTCATPLDLWYVPNPLQDLQDFRRINLAAQYRGYLRPCDRWAFGTESEYLSSAHESLYIYLTPEEGQDRAEVLAITGLRDYANLRRPVMAGDPPFFDDFFSSPYGSYSRPLSRDYSLTSSGSLRFHRRPGSYAAGLLYSGHYIPSVQYPDRELYTTLHDGAVIIVQSEWQGPMYVQVVEDPFAIPSYHFAVYNGWRPETLTALAPNTAILTTSSGIAGSVFLVKSRGGFYPQRRSTRDGLPSYNSVSLSPRNPAPGSAATLLTTEPSLIIFGTRLLHEPIALYPYFRNTDLLFVDPGSLIAVIEAEPLTLGGYLPSGSSLNIANPTHVAPELRGVPFYLQAYGAHLSDAFLLIFD